MVKRKGYDAWLVRWEWAGAHARVEQPIIAIFRPNTGPGQVRTFVERFYLSTYDPTEMLLYMRSPKDNPYRVRFGTTEVILGDGRRGHVEDTGEIVCGHNPWIVATLVHNLRKKDSSDGALTWDPHPKPVLDLSSG